MPLACVGGAQAGKAVPAEYKLKPRFTKQDDIVAATPTKSQQRLVDKEPGRKTAIAEPTADEAAEFAAMLAGADLNAIAAWEGCPSIDCPRGLHVLSDSRAKVVVTGAE